MSSSHHRSSKTFPKRLIGMKPGSPDWRAEFVEEIISVWDALADNPLLNCRRHPTKNIRWRYPDRFPYRVIYEVNEAEHTVKVAAVLHAARHDRHWKKRV